jgi:hypothetical protein
MRSILMGAVILGGLGCGGSGGSSNPDLSAGGDDMSMAMKTTIAAARGAGLMNMPITVDAVVIAVRGNDPVDTKTWYIEDAAGGPNSGVAIYCNHTAKTNPCPTSITAPALHDAVTVTGTLSMYKGEIEMYPTAETTNASNAALPPIPTVTASDLAPSGSSTNRGTLVKLATTVTVDSVTPTQLYDTQCAMTDAGGAMPLCSGCAPPTYSGFQVNDGAGHEVLIENTFYNSENLASSPECSTMGTPAVPVNVGNKFTVVTGVLDFDPNGMVQALSPVLDSDYTKQ